MQNITIGQLMGDLRKARVRVRRELGIESDGLLLKCGAYIAEFVTDEDEHAGIYSKYAWLMAEGLLAKGRAQEALKLCAAAFEELCRCDNEYFMRPLL